MAHFRLRQRSAIVSTILVSFLSLMMLIGPSTQSVDAVSVQVAHNKDIQARLSDKEHGNPLSADLEQYANRAYPNTTITFDQTMGAYNSFAAIAQNPLPQVNQSAWQPLGPTTGYVPAISPYDPHPTLVSGRVTALAVSPFCNQNFCPVWLGAAGGGIWATYNGLTAKPQWFTASKGIASNAIGSLVIDPTDPTGRTIYAGTGEPNGILDDEAGVGLYKSTDYGITWKLVPGSVNAAYNRAIGAIAIDPKNAKHIYIGTDLAARGFSSTRGGLVIPPGPQLGLYESTNGGATFNLVFSGKAGVFELGGVTKTLFDRTGLTATQPSRLYFSVYGGGVYRSTSNSTFERIFTAAGSAGTAENAFARTEFALAPNGNKLRVYVGDTSGAFDKNGNFDANLYRVDNANVPASTLTNGKTNPGWLKLSSATPGTPGYASYAFCSGQCFYDMVVASPPGRPDTVWINGQFQYREYLQQSNGRSVQRSTNAGVSFTDMTSDARTTPETMHPDQHAIAFVPRNPDSAFLGSDGGIVRTSGAFADTSASCSSRKLSGADLKDCQAWLKAIPTRIYNLNDGLATLMFQSLTYNPKNPRGDIIGGTQDNGTWAYNAKGTPTWFETASGDGGQSVIDAGNPNIRMHTTSGPFVGVNFAGTTPLAWDFAAIQLVFSREATANYIPLIGDPQVSQTMFAGLEHVWRTQDSGGPQAYLDKHCNELTLNPNDPAILKCGDWQPLGKATLDGTAYGNDKAGGYVGTISRAASDKNTMWTSTRFGRLFISKNANAKAAAVTFTRIDTAAQPNRFISGIAVDPKNANHAYVTYSGYNSNTPNTRGHVFDVTYNPTTGKATWKDISNGFADTPVTSVAYDGLTGNIYISTDFGVAVLNAGSHTWTQAASGLPIVAVYNLTLSTTGRVLYAATHGRAAWRLKLA